MRASQDNKIKTHTTLGTRKHNHSIHQTWEVLEYSVGMCASQKNTTITHTTLETHAPTGSSLFEHSPAVSLAQLVKSIHTYGKRMSKSMYV